MTGSSTSQGLDRPFGTFFEDAVQGSVPDQVRGGVFTLLAMSWNEMRLLSLVAGELLIDTLVSEHCT